MLSDIARREREGFARWIETTSHGRQLFHVAILSGLGLFVELLLIRWLDTQVRPLAYVKNLPLIASFLGLGIGFALADRSRHLFAFAIPLLVLALGTGALLGGTMLFGPAGLESNLGMEVATGAGQLLVFYLSIAGVFGLVVLATIPLGQAAGTFMHGLPALGAYTANVAGSLGGILLVFLLASFSAPPWVNALLAMGVMLAYVTAGAAVRGVALVLAVGCVAGMASLDQRAVGSTVWSPYNRIQVVPFAAVPDGDGEARSPGWMLRIQNLYYQRLLDLAEPPPEAVQRAYPFIAAAHYAYNTPYRWKRPERVLVVGAGTGNDVAAALRHGAKHVDAVEIDPEILRFGRALHPEDPYGDPRVRVFVDDARAFLKRSDEPYDLIVFGLLDSHLSSFSSFSSNIRLDNYVYTVESFAQAVGRLTPDGVLALSFYVEQPWVASRIDAMLREATGGPAFFTPLFYDDGYLFLVGPGLPETSGDPRVTLGVPEEALRENPPGPNARDDWPFLYLQDHRIPATVLWASAGVLVVSLVLVFVFFRGGVAFDRQMFFLGAGFLLVETRTIAQLGLLFGSTWQVSGIAIGVILALIVAANLIVARTGALSQPLLYGALGACLLANFAVPPGVALGAGPVATFSMAGFFVLPLFFAGLIFASRVRDRKELAPALASNLVGSVLGGLLENLSLVLGIAGLSLVAVALYGASYRR